MKKITLIMLVAMVPLLTMAQKRSKKGKEKVEKVVNKATYDFMIITGMTMMAPSNPGNNLGSSGRPALSNSRNKVKITFDFGGVRNEANTSLSEMQYRSMAHAVNGAAAYGWEFLSANVVDSGDRRAHYYYMRKQK